MFDSEDCQDIKVLNREVIRLKMSVDAAESSDKIVFLHYPPVTSNDKCEEIIQVLKENGIKKCYYGHLHGKSHQDAIEGCVDGINFKLVSADYLNFDLIKI